MSTNLTPPCERDVFVLYEIHVLHDATPCDPSEPSTLAPEISSLQSCFGRENGDHTTRLEEYNEVFRISQDWEERELSMYANGPFKWGKWEGGEVTLRRPGCGETGG